MGQTTVLCRDHDLQAKLNIIFPIICNPSKNCKIRGNRVYHIIYILPLQTFEYILLDTSYLYNKNVHGVSICHCIDAEF